jgi:hypothetical protein
MTITREPNYKQKYTPNKPPGYFSNQVRQVDDSKTFDRKIDTSTFRGDRTQARS